MAAAADDAFALAADELRRGDRERFLADLFAPEPQRRHLFALHAFNLEIARVREKIRDPLPGEIRLQWWRDAIAGDQPQGHPLAEALLETIRSHELPRKAFDTCLEARIFDLYDDPMPGRAELEGYCGETASVLIQLAALVLDRAAAPGVADAAGHAGCAQAIVGLVRALPLHRARGQCYVPRDLLAAAGTTPEAFVAGTDAPAAGRAVDALAALAVEHLASFEALAGAIPPPLRPAFLPLALSAAYLGRVGASDPLARSIDISTPRRHWLLFRRASRGW